MKAAVDTFGKEPKVRILDYVFTSIKKMRSRWIRARKSNEEKKDTKQKISGIV